MSEPADWAIELLASDEEILVPVKKLWKEYVSQVRNISLEEFMHALEAEDRIEMIRGTDESDCLREWSLDERIAYEQELESCGFVSGPRAKLKCRVITLEHIANMIEKHSSRMLESLAAAYDIRPADLSDDDEQTLFEAFERAVNLRARTQDATRPPHCDSE